MKLILEILPHTDDEQIVHRVIENFPATIGRGFQNDVILTDPHVSPLHLHIVQDGERWILSDLDSANGLFVNAVGQRGNSLPVCSGDVVRIGQTELRFYAPHHPVADTVRIKKAHPVFAWLARPLNAWASFVLAVAVVQGWAYLEIWSEEPGLTAAAAAAATTGSIVLWATLWSVAGRLIMYKSHFRSHLTIAGLCLIAGVIAWYIQVYVDFLSNENWLAQIVT